MLNGRIKLVIGLLLAVFVGSITLGFAKLTATKPTPLEHFDTIATDLTHINDSNWTVPKSRKLHALIESRDSQAPNSIPLAAFLELRAELAKVTPPQNDAALDRLRLSLDTVASLVGAKKASTDITFKQLHSLYTPKLSISWLGGLTVTLPVAQWFFLALAFATYLVWWSTLSTLNKKLDEGFDGSDISASLLFGSGGASLVLSLSILLIPMVLIAATGPYPWRYSVLFATLLLIPWHAAKTKLKQSDPPSPNLPALTVTNLKYPKLEFSLTNAGSQTLHISHVWCIALANIVDGMQTMRYAVGPKVQFRFNVEGDDQRVNVLGNQQLNLEPNEGQAFEIEVEAVNAVALVAIQLQSIDPKAGGTQLLPVDRLFLVTAPAEQPPIPGQIYLIERQIALNALIDRTDTLVDVGGQRINAAWQATFMRGAAGLFTTDAESELKQLLTAQPKMAGPVLASIAEQFDHSPHLTPTLAQLEATVSNPEALYALGSWDEGAFGPPIVQLLLNRVPRDDQVDYCLGHLDRTHRLPRVNTANILGNDEEVLVAALEAGFAVTRREWLSPVVQYADTGSIKYLMALLKLVPNMKRDIDQLLSGLLQDRRPNIEPNDDLQKVWLAWWADHQNDTMASLEWQKHSPTLAEADALVSSAEQSRNFEPLVTSDNVLARSWASLQPLSATDAGTLSQDPEERIRFQLALNDNVPAETVEAMCSDSHSEIRAILVWHKHQTKSGLEQLSQDADPDVAAEAQKRLDSWSP